MFIMTFQELCTVMAVLLHYFFLAAFFLMLVEGIQLCIYVFAVFHVHRLRDTAAMIFAAWCKSRFPTHTHTVRVRTSCVKEARGQSNLVKAALNASNVLALYGGYKVFPSSRPLATKIGTFILEEHLPHTCPRSIQPFLHSASV